MQAVPATLQQRIHVPVVLLMQPSHPRRCDLQHNRRPARCDGRPSALQQQQLGGLHIDLQQIQPPQSMPRVVVVQGPGRNPPVRQRVIGRKDSIAAEIIRVVKLQ